ncbi:S8 family serine peptidase [Daejeonella sp.]|uniref:S8 family serine peptidase n=1 Tax=Daejeonella sp. TaxID=2805397 RepID=UPI0025C0D115|nr:S8 family serine peptidase [Daejeonella sp.]
MRAVFLLFFFFAAFSSFGNDDPKSIQPRKFTLPIGVSSKNYLPNTIIVKFKEAKSDSELRSTIQSFSVKDLKLKSANINTFKALFQDALQTKANPEFNNSPKADSIGLNRIYELNYSSKKNIVELINELLLDPKVEYAEPSYIYSTDFVPNDPFYLSNQNFLRQVKADQAWDIIRNSSNSIIAIVDSGSDLDHVDLKANIILPGKDLVGLSGSNPIEDNDPDVKSDSTDHGVRVSGVASAVSNNGLGISSVAFNAKLMIVKAGADNNGKAIYRGYEGIKYAADNGAHIINCSWGGPGGGSFGQDIINYAISRGSLVIAAAGNENSTTPSFPASYPGVLGVAAVDASDRKASYSNYGSTISILAPGDVFSTANANRYGFSRGTSLSAPIVSSAAALVKARFPLFDMVQVREQLLATADNIDALNPSFAGKLGRGRLNVFRAVSDTRPAIRNQKLTILDKANGSRPAEDTLRLFFDLKNILSPASAVIAKLSSSNPNIQILDQELAVGNMATSEIKRMVGPFRVYLKPTITENELVEFTITYTASNPYTDQEKFQINVALDYLNIEVNQVSSSMTSIGRIGFSDANAEKGLGFIYKNDPLLYEASLMIGASSSQVSNNTRNDLGSADEHFLKKIKVFENDAVDVAFFGQSEFDDSASPKPINISVKNTIRAYSKSPDDKYILAEYELKNTSFTALNGIYLGLFTDWDVDANGRDVTQYDVFNRLGYVYGKFGATPYAGVKQLTTTGRPIYYPMSYQVVGDPLETGSGFSISEKFSTLSSGIKSTSLGENSANGYDVMFVSGNGPFNIPPNGSVKVAFALLAGDNLTDLQASAAAAQKKYDELYKELNELTAAGFILKQNYPNPAINLSTIEFGVAVEGMVSIQLYNSVGQSVRELYNGLTTRGFHTISPNLSDLSPGIYIYKMLYGGKEKSLKMIISR